MKLRSLDDYNQLILDSYRKKDPALGTGIACPSCDAELVRTSPGLVLTSYPPQENLHCPACGRKARRFV